MGNIARDWTDIMHGLSIDDIKEYRHELKIKDHRLGDV